MTSGGLGVSMFRRATAALPRLLHPSAINTLISDRIGIGPPPSTTTAHLSATMSWLLRAQNHGGNSGGVSAGYSLIDGWLPPYPETTGYIIPTFLDYSLCSGLEEYRARARKMADWELVIQLPNGAVPAGVLEAKDRLPAVFNTGQVILGWCRAFTEFLDARYLAAAKRAADWLTEIQDPKGAWVFTGVVTGTNVHAYDVRTAWSLLELHKLTNEDRYLDAACRNIAWTLSQQRENGWFDNNAFFAPPNRWSTPLTHTIAYVLEGLLDAARLRQDEQPLRAAQKAADRLLRIFETRRFMPGEFDHDWRGNTSFSCLTGDAQIAAVWLRLFKLTGDLRYVNAALKLNDYVKSTQKLRALHPGIRGGVKGSQPLYGKYTRYTYVNWGAKFLADSLMLEERIMTDLGEIGTRGGLRSGAASEVWLS